MAKTSGSSSAPSSPPLALSKLPVYLPPEKEPREPWGAWRGRDRVSRRLRSELCTAACQGRRASRMRGFPLVSPDARRCLSTGGPNVGCWLQATGRRRAGVIALQAQEGAEGGGFAVVRAEAEAALGQVGVVFAGAVGRQRAMLLNRRARPAVGADGMQQPRGQRYVDSRGTLLANRRFFCFLFCGDYLRVAAPSILRGVVDDGVLAQAGRNRRGMRRMGRQRLSRRR